MIATISRNLIKSIEWALTIQPMDVILHPSDTNTANQTRNETMKSLTIRNEVYPAIEASKLENGMTYFDGSEISNVSVNGKTTQFILTNGSIEVSRTVRRSSLIALSYEQVAVFV